MMIHSLRSMTSILGAVALSSLPVSGDATLTSSSESLMYENTRAVAQTLTDSIPTRSYTSKDIYEFDGAHSHSLQQSLNIANSRFSEYARYLITIKSHTTDPNTVLQIEEILSMISVSMRKISAIQHDATSSSRDHQRELKRQLLTIQANFSIDHEKLIKIESD